MCVGDSVLRERGTACVCVCQDSREHTVCIIAGGVERDVSVMSE